MYIMILNRLKNHFFAKIFLLHYFVITFNLAFNSNGFSKIYVIPSLKALGEFTGLHPFLTPYVICLIGLP